MRITINKSESGSFDLGVDDRKSCLDQSGQPREYLNQGHHEYRPLAEFRWEIFQNNDNALEDTAGVLPEVVISLFEVRSYNSRVIGTDLKISVGSGSEQEALEIRNSICFVGTKAIIIDNDLHCLFLSCSETFPEYANAMLDNLYKYLQNKLGLDLQDSHSLSVMFAEIRGLIYEPIWPLNESHIGAGIRQTIKDADEQDSDYDSIYNYVVENIKDLESDRKIIWLHRAIDMITKDAKDFGYAKELEYDFLSLIHKASFGYFDVAEKKFLISRAIACSDSDENVEYISLWKKRAFYDLLMIMFDDKSDKEVYKPIFERYLKDVCSKDETMLAEVFAIVEKQESRKFDKVMDLVYASMQRAKETEIKLAKQQKKIAELESRLAELSMNSSPEGVHEKQQPVVFTKPPVMGAATNDIIDTFCGGARPKARLQ